MRLLDRILFGGFDCLKPDLDVVEMSKMLRAAQLVVIDNVAEYHLRYEQPDKPIRSSDFPNVMLPFEHTFMEMRLNQDSGSTFREVGVLIDMQKPDDGLDLQTLGRRVELPEGAEMAYFMRCMIFVTVPGFKRPDLIGNVGFPVNKDGEIIEATNSRFVISGVVFGPDSESQSKDTKELLPWLTRKYIYPCLLALSLMHCKNVTVQRVDPPLRLSLKHRKTKGRPLLRYHVLRIGKMKQVLDQEGSASTEGLTRALHLCRGHFNTYGKNGRGLYFGKHVATVWIPLHTRGSLEEGVVVKDYAVD